jgi:hypothetical protein
MEEAPRGASKQLMYDHVTVLITSSEEVHIGDKAFKKRTITKYY